MASSSLGGQPGVWQSGSVVEVFSTSECRWLVALVTQVSKGQMSAWLADERGTLGPKTLSFSNLQLAGLGSNVTALPMGFQMVPSKSRPGQVAFLDHSEKRKYQTRELAWRCHIERNIDLSANLLTSQASASQVPAAQSAPRDIYASPPGDLDMEPPPQLPVARRVEASAMLPGRVKVEPQQQPQPPGPGLCSAATLPRAAPVQVERPQRAQVSVEAAPRFAGERAFAHPASPRCGGTKCGMFCPLRLKRLATPGEEGLNLWARRQRRRAAAAAAAPAAVAAAPAPAPERRRAEAAPAAPRPPAAQPAAPRAEDAPPAPRQPSKAAAQYADQVAAALARTSGMPANQRTPLFHFPALVAMGFPPAQARRALESTSGDLALAVEYCVSGGQVPAPAQPVVVEASQPGTQQPRTPAPALPFARTSPRRGNSVDSWPMLDTAEDRLRAAEEAAAFADELHEEAVAAAIAECESLAEEALSPAGPASCSDAFDEALQFAWERYREEAPEPAKQCAAADDLPASLLCSTPAASQTQPEAPRGGRRAGAARARRGAGRPRATPASKAASAAAVEAKKLGEEPGACAGVQFFDGPMSLPLAAASQATQPEEPARRRGGRRAGSPPRGRAGRARAQPVPAEPACSLKEEEDDEASVKEEDAEEDEDLFGDGDAAAPGVAEATQAPEHGPSDAGPQQKSFRAAAIDVPDDFDMEDSVPATGASAGQDESYDPIAASAPLRAPWDEASQVPAGENALTQPCASPLLPEGCSSLPCGPLDTQADLMATAWEPSAMY